jgi:ATP/maltotriose-dependent transcriptional regulator MalT
VPQLLLDPRGQTDIEQEHAREHVVREAKLRPFSPAPQMISRPRLCERLVGTRAALVLLAAPPGFGKTTLLAQWKDAEERPFAWLSLDDSDNDPTILWAGILDAIRRVRPGFGSAAEAALNAAHVNVLDVVVPLMLHELQESDEDLALALDDYQALVDAECHDSIAFFIEAKPASVQLVLATRADPPIPVAKLRAAGELLELRALDLCFTAEEEAAFLNGRLGLDLAPEILDALYERTEGWPAGVYLASLSLQDTEDPSAFAASFGGSNRHVVDYLTEVVLGKLDAERRSFLLDTSILESLASPVCDAVTGRNDSAERLAELERANLFLIPLDDRRERYRYHQLFAGLLRNQLAQREPDLVPQLHRRASTWLRQSGQLEDAIRHAVAAGELATAGDLLAERWLAYPEAHFGRPETFARWLEPFPLEAVDNDPRLAVLQAWAYGMQRARGEAEEALARAEAAPDGFTLGDGTPLHTAIAVVRACFPWGDVARFRAAAEALPFAELSPFWRPAALYALGWARYLSGDLEGAKSPFDEAALAAHAVDQVPVLSAAYAVRARIALAEGEFDDAERLARGSLDVLVEQGFDDRPGAGLAHVALGAVLVREGRTEEAGALLVRGLVQLRLRGDPLEIAGALLVYAPVRRSLESLPAARALIEEAALLLSECGDPGVLPQALEEVARSLTPGHRRVEGASDLTERELEVLRYLAEGLPKRDIGRVLFLSYNTIHSHTKSIYQKLRVSSREAAVARARQLGAL